MISPIDLQALLGSPGNAVTLLDVRFRLDGSSGEAGYAAGHIPGATYVDLDLDLAAPPGDGGRHPLPEPGRFVESMRRAGVSTSTPVVVYDDWSGRAAARAWWLLRHYGKADVRVLDGGWTAWLARGGDIRSGTEAPPRGDFQGAPGSMAVVDAETVREAAIVIDARAEERFRGEREPIDAVAGHIPGAVNVPTERKLDEHGRFVARDGLRALYAGVGATAGRDVAAYCGSGVTAAHDVLALAVAGVSAALYPGSWSDWIADSRRPIATGPA